MISFHGKDTIKFCDLVIFEIQSRSISMHQPFPSNPVIHPMVSFRQSSHLQTEVSVLSWHPEAPSHHSAMKDWDFP